MRHLHPRRITRRRIEVEPHFVAGLDVDLDVRKPAQPQLGSLQVGQHAQRSLQCQLRPAHGLQRRRMILMRAMAEIQPEDIDPGLRQGLDHAGCPAGGSQGRDDTGAPGSFHRMSMRSEESVPCAHETAPG